MIPITPPRWPQIGPSLIRYPWRGVWTPSGEEAWTPLSLGASLVVWNDASQLTGFSEDDLVDSFTDFSGNGFHATSAGGERPLYKATGINGLSTIWSWGDGSPRTSTIAGVGALSEWYSWAVIKADFPTGHDVPIAWADYPDAAATWKLLEIHDLGGTYKYRLNCSCLSYNSADLATVSVGTVTAVLLEAGPTYLNVTTDDGSSSNHVLSGVGSATGARSDHDIRFFKREDIGPFPFNGHIGEFGIATGALSAANRTALWAYLNAKWGTAIP